MSFVGPFVGRGGGGSAPSLSINLTAVSSAATGDVAQLFTNLSLPTFSENVDVANISVSGAGVVSLATALGIGGSRVLNASVSGTWNGAPASVAIQFTLTAVPTLAALTIGATTLTAGMAAGATVAAISGKSAGSTVAMTGAAFASNKLAVNAGGTEIVVGIAGPLTLNDTTGTFSLVETLAGATNTPLASGPFASITVANATFISLATLPGTPVLRYAGNHSANTQTSGRATSIQNLANGARPVTHQAAGLGALLETDANGNTYFRFRGYEIMECQNVAGALRDFSCIVIGRYPCSPPVGGARSSILSLGSRNQGTAIANQGAAAVSTLNPAGTGIAYLTAMGNMVTTLSDRYITAMGTQLAVWGVNSRSGTCHQYYNNERVVCAQPNNVAPGGTPGWEIGCHSSSPESAGFLATQDIYEMVVYSPALSVADMDAAVAALVTAANIAPITNHLVVSGDSLTAGRSTDTPAILPGQNVASRMTDPGAAWKLPGSWKVIPEAISGSTVASLAGRRDATNGIFSATRPGGRNVVAVHIGINDILGGATAATVRTRLKDYIQTTAGSVGLVERGWEVELMTNTACAFGAQQAVVATLRGLITDASFLTDALTGSGQAFAGKLRVRNMHLWAPVSPTIWETQAQAGVADYYGTDGLHFAPKGALELAKATNSLMGLA